MTIFKYEIKKRFTGIIIWTLIWIGMAALFLSLFETFSDQADEFARYMESFPPEMMNAFNINSELFLTDLRHFIGGEFLTFYLISISIYSAIIGSSTIGDMIRDKDLVFWLTQPISRVKFYTQKLLSVSIILLISNLIVILALIPMILGFTDQEVPYKYILNIIISTSFFTLLTLNIGNIISIILNTQKTVGIAISLILGTWMIDTLSKMDGFPDFLKYISPYYYFDINYLNTNASLDWQKFIIIPILLLIFIVLSGYIFNKKDYSS